MKDLVSSWRRSLATLSHHPAQKTPSNRNLVLALVLALGMSTLGNGVTSANPAPSAQCSGGGTVTIVGTAITISSGCLGTLTMEGVTEIQEAAFRFSQVSSALISDSVRSIGTQAFAASALTSIQFGANSQLLTIGAQAFQQASSLASVSMPDSLQSIGLGAFYLTTSLESVHFGPNSRLEEIGAAAFRESALTSISIPDSVTTISEQAFMSASNLVSVSFGQNAQLEVIDDFTFQNAGLTSIAIPDSVTEIGIQAFLGTSSLSSVTFGPESRLDTILDSAFMYATSLESITIPDSLRVLAIQAFNNTWSLSSVIFGPQSRLEQIGFAAFSGRSSLTAISIPATVTQIGAQAFDGVLLSSVTFLGPAPQSVGAFAFDGVAAGAQAKVSRAHVDTFTLTAGFWNGLEVTVPAFTLALRSVTGDLAQQVEFGGVPTPPSANRDGFELVGWSTRDGGGTLLLSDLSDFVMDAGPATLFAVWSELAPPELEPEVTEEPVQFSGPLLGSVDQRVFQSNQTSTMTFTGKRLNQIQSATLNGVELVVLSASRSGITFEIPKMSQGLHSLVLISRSGSLTLTNFVRVD